jgi:hypothetical protein
MYIRSKEEAVTALAETLGLAERRNQIIDVTVKLVLCLHPDARAFLADALDGIIAGGLEAMARKRREALEALQGPEVFVIVNPDADRLFESAARALDALHIAGVAADVFPALGARTDRWRIARAVIQNEEGVRACVLDGVRARGAADTPAHDAAQRTLALWIDQATPPWEFRADALRQVLSGFPLPDLAFAVAAADDAHAAPFLEAVDRGEGPQFAANLVDILQTLRRLEAESGRPTDSKSYRRVA